MLPLFLSSGTSWKSKWNITCIKLKNFIGRNCREFANFWVTQKIPSLGNVYRNIPSKCNFGYWRSRESLSLRKFLLTKVYSRKIFTNSSSLPECVDASGLMCVIWGSEGVCRLAENEQLTRTHCKKTCQFCGKTKLLQISIVYGWIWGYYPKWLG